MAATLAIDGELYAELITNLDCGGCRQTECGVGKSLEGKDGE